MPISSAIRCTLGASVVLCTASIGLGGAKAEPVVAAGHSVSLMTASSIDQMCHSQGPVTVNVIVPPRGGFLEIFDTKAYPNFNTLNTRARCNTRKLPATEVIYQSAGNYLGSDSVTLELIFPGGNARRVRLPITVRPVTAAFAPAPPADATTLAPAAPADAATVAPLPSSPAAPSRSKRVAHHKGSAVAAVSRHHPCQGTCGAPGGKAAAHPQPAPRTPLVST